MLQTMLPPDDPIVANRRARLRAWIETRFGGSHAMFIASTNNGEKQLNQGELSGLLRSKSFGERRARSLEAMAHMPPRYLDDMSETTSMAPTCEEKPPRFNPPDHPQLPPPTGWPFSKVSLARLVGLKKALGPKIGAAAMEDIEETLDFVVTKWERRISQRTKSAA